MAKTHDRPQPQELSTKERLQTTGGAVAQAAGMESKGETQREDAAREPVRLADAQRIIESWPDAPKRVAAQMLEKYGPPNEATPTKLFWYRNGPWKRTEITSEAVAHNWPTPHTDFLTQTIAYRVPPERTDEIVQFDGSIVVDRTRGEVSARCDSEAANCLGINMVHEIVTGKRTYAEAREITVQQTVAWNIGRSAPYAERLLFEVPDGGTEDLDKSEISKGLVKQAAGKLKDLVTGEKEEATDRRTGTDVSGDR